MSPPPSRGVHYGMGGSRMLQKQMGGQRDFGQWRLMALCGQRENDPPVRADQQPSSFFSEGQLDKANSLS